MADFDLAIIGGGINGTAIARDAAGRGLRVLLVEQNDLGSGTSSASSKLIHGGLRYLEHWAFRLVREALQEREVLLRTAPHIVWPMRFMLPPTPEGRSPILLRSGLFLYDHLSSLKLLPPTRTVDLTHHAVGQPLKRTFRYGFEYSDCWVDDARFVVLNAMDAAERGADIRTRTRCMRAERLDDEWELVLNARGRRDAPTARVLINAAGPWIGQVADTIIRVPLKNPVRLVKGSHIVVKRHYAHEHGYTLQAPDGRVVFALPFGEGYTLIGTTDKEFVGDINSPTPSAEEISYLISVVNRYFRDVLTPTDVLWAFAGIRSLLDDGSKKPDKVTRDYSLVLDKTRRKAPLLTVYGGKITTARRLAEAAMKKLRKTLEPGPDWTHQSPLPGGDFAVEDAGGFIAQTRERWPFLSEASARRLVRAYGQRVERILGDAKAEEDLGPRFGEELTGAEVRYLMQNEWVREPEDVLWRRTKLGLTMPEQDRLALAGFMAGETAR